MAYQHLELEERQYVYALHKQRFSLREIARRVHRSASTVLRELKRNQHSGLDPYLDEWSKAKKAQDRAIFKRKQSRARVRIRCARTRSYIVEKLKCGWSPELIAGRLALEPGQSAVCHETIYQWIYCEQRQLQKYLLRVSKRGNRKRSSRKRYRNKEQAAKPKRSIRSRSKTVHTRKAFGHWEADTIVSRQSKACIYTLIERKSRYVFFTKLDACTGKDAYYAAIMRLEHLPAASLKSLTLDNGGENSKFDDLEKRLKLKTYFCDPYCSWQRGSVENANGILRRFLPKKTDFRTVTKEQIQQIQDFFNHRPMKVLQFRTPHEVFQKALSPLLKKKK